MSRLVVFNHVSVDGYFVDLEGAMTFAHGNRDDAEWNAFVAENAAGGGVLLFGRVTYDLMRSYWPTPPAFANDPGVAERMNGLPKVVFSRTLDVATWANTRLVKGDPAAEVRRMKREPGSGMAILGSGSIVSQLAAEGLVDEFQLVVNPVVLGGGRPLFEGVPRRLPLRLTRSRAFANGKVLLCYQPA